jgi:hypothetical protein
VIPPDPADNTLKFYGRTADTTRGAVGGGAADLARGATTGAPTARPAIPVGASLPKAADILASAKPYYRAFSQDAQNSRGAYPRGAQ